MKLIDSLIPNKACKELVHWIDKHCSLCKKHGGVHIMHNMCDCNWYISSGTSKKSSGSARPHQKDHNPQGANFVQIVQLEYKKVFCTAFKKAARGKKHCNHLDKSDINSDSDF